MRNLCKNNTYKCSYQNVNYYHVIMLLSCYKCHRLLNWNIIVSTVAITLFVNPRWVFTWGIPLIPQSSSPPTPNMTRRGTAVSGGADFPASRSNTVALSISESLAATTEPAQPAPTAAEQIKSWTDCEGVTLTCILDQANILQWSSQQHLNCCKTKICLAPYGDSLGRFWHFVFFLHYKTI